MYFSLAVAATVEGNSSGIIYGTGRCHADERSYRLEPGAVFHIHADWPHRFTTYAEGLHLVVFHSDSDMGFSDRHHPMLSRALVNNVSAVHLPDIQTLR